MGGGGGILDNSQNSRSNNSNDYDFSEVKDVKTSKNHNSIETQLNFKNQKSKSRNFGFSLIELSIVLIIIGLLVAGITGGASLINSAKSRALTNEFTNYQKAIYAFYSANGKYPGDLENKGIFGTGAYDGTKTISGFTDFNPTAEEAPFVEMHLEKVIDFKPTSTTKFPKSVFAGEYKFSANKLVLEAKVPIKAVEQMDRNLDNGDLSSGKITAECNGDDESGDSDAYVSCVLKKDPNQSCVMGIYGNANSSNDCECPLDSKRGCKAAPYGNSDSQLYICKSASESDNISNICTAVVFEVGL